MGAGMTTADWALVISLCSLFVAGASFVWNVWSKFIYPKPRIEVTLAYILAITPGEETDTPGALMLRAVNHGPSEAELTTAIGRMKRRKFWKRPNGAILKSYNQWPFELESFTIGGFGLPKRLIVGEEYRMYLRPSPNNYEDLSKFGFADTFNREHWATARSVKYALKSLAQ